MATMKKSFPLISAITNGMLVKHGKRTFIMPMSSIQEILHIQSSDCILIKENTEFMEFRSVFLPVFRIDELLFSERNQVPTTVAIIINHNETKFILACELVLEQVQVVMKSLGQSLDHTQGISGGAILSDGNIGLVLDIEGLAQKIKIQSLKWRQHDVSN